MRNFIAIPVFLLLVLQTAIAQDITWPVKAINNAGDQLPVKAIFENGDREDLIAVLKDGDAHFMDVKIIKDGSILPVKLLISNDYYVPMKAITKAGKIVDIKALTPGGEILDVKGVSRIGNTVKIAAITETEEFFPLKAVSDDGQTRDVFGVKLSLENIEMEISGIKVMAHVKALPEVIANEADELWPVKSVNDEGEDMELVVLNDKGNEFPVQAKMVGNSFHLLNVKAISRVDIDVKVLRGKSGLYIMAIDEYARKMQVKAKLPDGSYLNVVPGKLKGNIIPIYTKGKDGKLFPVKAFSSQDHIYDVKGIKVLEGNVEGVIEGFTEKVSYYAHVKALPPIQKNVN